MLQITLAVCFLGWSLVFRSNPDLFLDGLDPCFRQCCETGNAGTATFCLCGTGTVTHFGSGTGSNIKWKTKVKKIKNERPIVSPII
jgi:hypothetical protein